jgi:general secretion pathway protein N
MIRFCAVLGLAGGLVAFAESRPSAFAATDPTGRAPVDVPIEAPAIPSVARPGLEAVGPANPVGRPPSGNPLWAVPFKSLSATRERPIFSPSRRPPPPPVIAAPFAPAAPPPPPRPSEPDHPLLTLLGTIVGATEGIGIFYDDATREVVRLKTGEEHAGWRLRSIQGREAIFRKNLRDVTLALPAPGTTEQGAQHPIAGPGLASSKNSWMDGDGQMITPPLGKSAPPVASSSPRAQGVDARLAEPAAEEPAEDPGKP